MILLIFVGSIFLGVAFIFFLKENYFAKYGVETFGFIFGIERYKSKTRSSNSSSSTQIYYRPLIKYTFDGKDYIFSSSTGSNTIGNYKINQKVALLSLPEGPEYVQLKNSRAYGFIWAFGLIGMVSISIGLYQFMQGQMDIKNLFPLLIFGVGVIFVSAKVKSIQLKLSASGKHKSKMMNFFKARMETKESLKGRTIFTSNQELEKVLGKNNLVGLIISLLFAGGVWTGLYFFVQNLRPAKKQRLGDIFLHPENWSEIQALIQPTPDKDFLAIGILAFFSLLSIYSLVYSLRKLNEG